MILDIRLHLIISLPKTSRPHNMNVVLVEIFFLYIKSFK